MKITIIFNVQDFNTFLNTFLANSPHLFLQNKFPLGKYQNFYTFRFIHYIRSKRYTYRKIAEKKVYRASELRIRGDLTAPVDCVRFECELARSWSTYGIG